MASIDQVRIPLSKNYHDSHSNHVSKPQRPSRGKKEARSVEVGALAAVLENSTTELKHRQNLLKCKSIINVAIFKVGTLKRIGEVPELTASAVEHNINIVCLQELSYHHREVEIKYLDPGNGWTFVSVSAWKNSVNTFIGIVGILLSPHAVKSLKNIEKIQPKMMVATFNGNPSTTPSTATILTMLAIKMTSTPSITSIPKLNFLIFVSWHGRDTQ